MTDVPISDVPARDDGPDPADRRFPRRKRVKLQRDFQRVYAFRARAYNPRVAICCAPTDENAPARLGLSVSKKVGNACARNRWKRLVREAFRLLGSEIPQGYDFVAIPQKGVAPPDFDVVMSDLRDLTKRAVKKARRNLDALNSPKTLPSETPSQETLPSAEKTPSLENENEANP